MRRGDAQERKIFIFSEEAKKAKQEERQSMIDEQRSISARVGEYTLDNNAQISSRAAYSIRKTIRALAPPSLLLCGRCREVYLIFPTRRLIVKLAGRLIGMSNSFRRSDAKRRTHPFRLPLSITPAKIQTAYHRPYTTCYPLSLSFSSSFSLYISLSLSSLWLDRRYRGACKRSGTTNCNLRKTARAY